MKTFTPYFHDNFTRRLPLLSSGINKSADHYDGHQADRQEVAVFGMKFRHIIEIHSVEAGNKGDRQKINGVDGKNFHDLVSFLIRQGQKHRNQVGDLDIQMFKICHYIFMLIFKVVYFRILQF